LEVLAGADCDRHSMEHPMFSLSKTPDRHIRHYEHNGIDFRGLSISVMPALKLVVHLSGKNGVAPPPRVLATSSTAVN
jgi:Replication initiator protein A